MEKRMSGRTRAATGGVSGSAQLKRRAPLSRPWCESIVRENRFWLKVYQRGDCWEWRGHRNREGYGIFRGHEAANVNAHRFAYELAKGSIPSHLEIDHICRHRWCVKPTHLEAVTHRVNVLRGISVVAIAATRTHCPHGHPYDEANTQWRGRGGRECRACHLAQQRRRRAREKNEAR